jgi:hypothetical protein
MLRRCLVDANAARKWLIVASLGILVATFAFLLIAPLAFPLNFSQAQRLMEILLPVFLGYLGSAAQFVFGPGLELPRVIPESRRPFVALLIRGPLMLFAFMSVVLLGVFGYTNRATAPLTGMSFDMLATLFSLLLSMLAATTNVAVTYLFSVEPLGHHARRTATPGSQD